MNRDKWNLLARAVEAKLQGKTVKLVGPYGNLWDFDDPSSFGTGGSVESIKIIEQDAFIPWTQNQVPFAAKYRLKSHPDTHFFMKETTPYKVFFGAFQISYKELLERCECMFPSDVGKWVPCGVGVKAGGES